MNKKLIGFLVSITVVTAVGYGVYQNKVNNDHISKYKTEIVSIYENFEKEEDRNAKIEKLKNLLSEQDAYKKGKKVKDKVLKEYDLKINEMKKYFKNEYDKLISENTIENIADGDNSKEDLNSKKEALAKVLETIKSEVDLVLDSNSVSEYETKINELTKSYEDRIKEIEEAKRKAKEEEEKKLKEEAERKAKEEEAKKQQSSYNNSSTQSSGSNSSNKKPSSGNSNSGSSKPSGGNGSSSNKPSNGGSKPSGGNWYDGMKHSWSTDANGNKIPGTDRYHDSKGNVYDSNKNLLFNKNDWFDRIN